MKQVNTEATTRQQPFSPLSEVLQMLKLDISVFQNDLLTGDWSLEDDGRSGCRIFMVTQGECYLDIPQEYTGQLAEGDCVVLSGEVSYTMTPLASGTATRLLCGQAGFLRFGGQHIFDSLPSVSIIRFKRAPKELRPPLRRMVQQGNESDAVLKDVLNPLAQSLLVHAARESVRKQPDKVSIFKLYEHDRLSQAVVKMHQQPENNWALGQLANMLEMSRTSFAEKFRDTSGWTAGHYLYWWRMQLAWELLQTGKDIPSVMEQTGFRSESAFSRAFKRMFNVTPGKVKMGKVTTPLGGGLPTMG